jgi:hypothetical protein
MKKTMFTAVACLGTLIGFATRPAAAQNMLTVHVNLPMAAKVGDVSLPAGEYSIRELSNSVIEISSDAHKGVNTFATVSSIIAPNHEVAGHTSVVLHHGANGYQIDKIWLEGQDLGFELTTGAE